MVVASIGLNLKHTGFTVEGFAKNSIVAERQNTERIAGTGKVQNIKEKVKKV